MAGSELRLYVAAVLLKSEGAQTLASASWLAHSEDEARGGVVAKLLAELPGSLIESITVSPVPDHQIAAIAGGPDGRR